METIFDYSPSDSEMEDLLGVVLTKEKYIEKRTESDEILADLYALFMYRKDQASANKYLDSINNKEFAESLKNSFF